MVTIVVYYIKLKLHVKKKIQITFGMKFHEQISAVIINSKVDQEAFIISMFHTDNFFLTTLYLNFLKYNMKKRLYLPVRVF